MSHAHLLPWIADIGRDRFVDRSELPSSPRLDAAWRLYRDEFDGFTGATLDPQFNRLQHPAGAWGSLQLSLDAPVLVVGSGPSLARDADRLKRIRRGVLLFTSLRGAEALATHGLAPDLVIIEHRSPLDALLSSERRSHVGGLSLPSSTFVAAEARTPGALIDSVTDRLFLPATAGFWGLWPATAVAWAAGAGAGSIGLLGVDLGTPEELSPEYASLASLLALLADVGGIACADFGAGAAPKRGWPRASLDDLPVTVQPQLLVRRHPIRDSYFYDTAERWHATSRAIVPFAREALALAMAVRDGSSHDHASVATTARIMLSWRDDQRLRHGLQDELGLTFLPKLWRIGINLQSDAALWRPVVLALHELIDQTDRLTTQLMCRPRRAALA